MSSLPTSQATPRRSEPGGAPRHAIVVGNPAARGVTDELMDELGALLRDLGAETTTLWTSRAGEATSLTEDAVRGLADGGRSGATVIAVGGDGTVQEVAEGLVRGLRAWPDGATAQSDSGLFIVPAGAGNSFYWALWPDTDWRDALRAACSPRRRLRHVDLLHVRETSNATVLGVNVGLGARVAELLAGAENVDETIRWQAIGQALTDAAAFPGRVTLDGQPLYEGPISQVSVGGVRRFLGGAFEFLPRAELDDGWLDVCVIAELDEAAIGELAPLVPVGGHIGHPLVRYAKGRTARIERTDGGELTLEHDGDVRARRRAVTIEAVPRVLPIAVSDPTDVRADDPGRRARQPGSTGE